MNSHSLLQEVDGAAARLVEEGGEPELVPDGGVGAEEDLLVGGVERAEVVLAARDVVGDDAVEAVEAAVALVVHLAAEVDGRRQVADEGVVPVAEHLREEKGQGRMKLNTLSYFSSIFLGISIQGGIQ